MLKVIEVSGTPFEMGVEWGSKARNYIRAGARFYRRHWRRISKLSWEKSVQILRPTIPLTRKLLPKTFIELQGVGKGSGVGWEELFVINSLEALECFKLRNKCTSIIAGAGRRVFLAHNEDWVWADRKWLYVLRARPKGEPAFLCVAYGAWIQTYGLNDAGIGYVADSDSATDARIGLAQTFVGREIMRARTVNAAVRRVISLPRADGHTYVLASARGGAIALETTARRHAILHPHVPFVHTNFYQTSQLFPYTHDPRRGYSRFRHARAIEILQGNATASELFGALSDHASYPKSICCHLAGRKGDQTKEQTIASMVMDLARKTLLIIPGNPCRGNMQKFTL